MNTINLEFAEQLGREFAADVNGSADADNWSKLGQNDDVPDGDYVELRDHYGFRDLEHEQIKAIETAYKTAFNSVFVPINAE